MSGTKAERDPGPHEHDYDRWFPFDATTLWRYCNVPGCHHFQTRKATT